LKGARKKSSENLKALAELLDAEILNLRVVFLEISKNYESRIEKDMQTTREYLSKLKDSATIRGSKVADLKAMLSFVKDLQIKPERGRRKDLKKIEDTICEVLNILEALK